MGSKQEPLNPPKEPYIMSASDCKPMDLTISDRCSKVLELARATATKPHKESEKER